MNLFTKDLIDLLPPIGATEDLPDDKKMAAVKFFNPCGSQTWWVFEAAAVTHDGEEVPLSQLKDINEAQDVLLFGYVTGMVEDEWGYTSLRELQDVKGPLGIGIERDRYYHAMSFDEIVKGRP